MTATGHGLNGSWTHSFEEDSGEEQVFRPSASFAFPKSRRPRDTIDFGAGQMITGISGPDDKVQHTSTSLTPLGMNILQVGNTREIEVVEVAPDMLKVRNR